MDSACSSREPADIYIPPFRQLQQSLPCEPPTRQLPKCSTPTLERTPDLGSHCRSCSCNFSSSTQRPGDVKYTNTAVGLRYSAPFDLQSPPTNSRSPAVYHAADISGITTGMFSSLWAPRQVPQSSVGDCMPTSEHSSERTYGSKISDLGNPVSNEGIYGDGGCRRYGPNSPKPKKKFILYKWCLLRPMGHLSSEVAVGGFLLFGAIYDEKVVTTPIVERLEKCKLLTKDGAEVWLIGLIDDCTTVSNGFSPKIVDMFLSGFPYIWKRLVDNEFPARSTISPECGISQISDFSGGNVTSQVNFEGGGNKEKDVQHQHPADGEEEVPVSFDLTQTGCGLKSAVKKDQAAAALPEKQDCPDLIQEKHIAHPQEDKCEVEATIMTKEQTYSVCAVPQIIGCRESPGTTYQEIDTDNFDNGVVKGAQGKDENQHGAADLLDCRIIIDGTNIPTHQQRETAVELISDTTISKQLDRSRGSLGRTHKAKVYMDKSKISSCITRSAARASRSLDIKQNRFNDSLSESACMVSESLAQQNREADHSPELRGAFDPSIELVTLEKNEGSQCEKRQLQEKCLNVNVASDQKPEGEDMATHKLRREPCLTRSRSRANKNLVESDVEVWNASQEKGFVNMKKDGNMLTKIESAGDFVSSKSGRKRIKMLPPPLPRPRVAVSTRIITTAFGLKTSRSGRVLVPPLAHWRNEALVRDVDGRIIAILDGCEESNKVDVGYSNIKFPSAAGARKLQKQLCAAAIERRSNRKTGRKE